MQSWALKLGRNVVMQGLSVVGMICPAQAAVKQAGHGTHVPRTRTTLSATERGTRKDSLYLMLYGASLIGGAVAGAAMHGARERRKEDREAEVLEPAMA